MRIETINHKKYILVIVDDYTRFGWVRFLRSKDEAPEEIKNFIKNTHVSHNATVRFVRTDNGTEFVNKTLTDYFQSLGITHQTSVPRTPQQNGVVERRNRTIMESARTMLIFAKAPMFLWAEAVATACHTINRSLVYTLHGKTYYELLKGKKPNVSYFRVFGSVNKRTRKIQETVHVTFEELTEGLTSTHNSVGLAPNSQTSIQSSAELEVSALQSGRTRSATVTATHIIQEDAPAAPSGSSSSQTPPPNTSVVNEENPNDITDGNVFEPYVAD
nr:hypothetical protein [Tanacetum cinerariifolium]